MIRMILCEGETDAILLSYYLGKVCGWRFAKKPPKGFAIRVDRQRGETVNWYHKTNAVGTEEYLLICSVGGVNNFESFYKAKLENAILSSGETIVSKIAIVVDRDQRESTQILGEFKNILPLHQRELLENQWGAYDYVNAFGEEFSIEVLFLIIPNGKEGALETLLLDCLSNMSEADCAIVARSKTFIDDIVPVAKKYITKNRLKRKAQLGVVFAVQSPQKVFSVLNEEIESVPWEESKLLQECFCELVKI